MTYPPKDYYESDECKEQSSWSKTAGITLFIISSILIAYGLAGIIMTLARG